MGMIIFPSVSDLLTVLNLSGFIENGIFLNVYGIPKSTYSPSYFSKNAEKKLLSL